jgi:hypothetical protein
MMFSEAAIIFRNLVPQGDDLERGRRARPGQKRGAGLDRRLSVSPTPTVTREPSYSDSVIRAAVLRFPYGRLWKIEERSAIISDVSSWHPADVHAVRYFGRYRGKNGHTASTREPTRLTHHVIFGRMICCGAAIEQLGWRNKRAVLLGGVPRN